jgi:hypothetical protein
MAQDTRDDNTLEPTEQDSNHQSTKATGTLSTDEMKMASKPSVIRPLRPLSSETKTASLTPVDAEPPVKFDLPRAEAVPHRPDALPERPLAKPDPTRETAVLSDNNPILKRMMSRSTQGSTSRLGEGREVLLVIRGMVERVMMVEGKTYKLGRFEVSTRKEDEIDLSPYGALDRGVSRVHAALSLQNDHIYITDLTSTNGTYLGGQRLKPNEATLLRKGDELLIGRLPVQVLFR